MIKNAHDQISRFRARCQSRWQSNGAAEFTILQTIYDKESDDAYGPPARRSQDASGSH